MRLNRLGKLVPQLREKSNKKEVSNEPGFLELKKKRVIGRQHMPCRNLGETKSQKVQDQKRGGK